MSGLDTTWLTRGGFEPPRRALDPDPPTEDERKEAREVNDAGLEWPIPEPLQTARKLPVFPTQVLPSALREFVEAESMATQTPLDMAAMFALGAVATVTGGRVVVEPVPGWIEGTNLFLTVAMEPGSRKSAVERDVKAPIVEHERTLGEKELPNIAEAGSKRRMAEARRDQAEKNAARAKTADRFALEQEALTAAHDVEAIVVPPLPRYFTADATPEALASLLAAHGGRMAVLSAEGGIFDLMAGRYSSGIPNLDVFLSGHAGDTLRVDRRNRPAEFVDRPALTMVLAAQPHMLRKIGQNSEMSGRGLLDRFLYAVPVGNVGYRRSSPPSVPREVRTRYASAIVLLAASLAEYEREPYVLRLEPDAVAALTAWRETLEPRRRPDGDLGAMQGWASKLDGATVRIAGLLHLATHISTGFGQPISVATMQDAIEVAKFLIPHAGAAFGQMGEEGPLEDARVILRWIIGGKRATFTRRECYRSHRGRFPHVEDIDSPLEILIDHSWIQLLEEDERRPGRPSIQYRVNPRIAAQPWT